MADDNIYINLTINGEPDIDKQLIKKCEMKKSLNQVILQNREEYYCSCMRFVLPLNLAPKMIFYINEGITQTDKNQGVYGIGFRYYTSTYFRYVKYIPQNDFDQAPYIVRPPSENNGKQDFNNYYYAINNYQSFANSINETLNDLWLDVNNDYPGEVQPNGLYLYWDDTLERFRLIYSEQYLIPNFDVYTNIYFRDILSGFPFYVDNKSPFPGCPFRFNLIPKLFELSTFGTFFGLEYFYIENDSKTIISYVNCLNNILIVSNTLGIVPEYIISESDRSNFNLQNVIFNFRPDPDVSIDNSVSTMVYTASVPKLSSISSKGPLNEIDISVFWTDIKGNVFPVFISPDVQFSIKLGFFKKSLYNNDPNSFIKKLN